MLFTKWLKSKYGIHFPWEKHIFKLMQNIQIQDILGIIFYKNNIYLHIFHIHNSRLKCEWQCWSWLRKYFAHSSSIRNDDVDFDRENIFCNLHIHNTLHYVNSDYFWSLKYFLQSSHFGQVKSFSQSSHLHCFSPL